MNDVKEKIANARSQLEDVRQKKVELQDSIRQLELTEAALLGFIEALSPYESEHEIISSQDVPEDDG